MRALLPLAATIVALTGCGGSDEPLSKADYEQEMGEIASEVGEQTDVEAPPDDASPAEQAEFIEQLQERLREGADRFDEVSPPAEVEEAHADYVTGIRGIADDLEPMAEAARDADEEALLRYQEESPYPSPETRQRLAAARGAFQRAGYRISEGFP
jgi:hypothetical protein